jgi:type IV pilus assembly protein PilM
MAEKKLVGIDFTQNEIRMAQISVGRGLPRVERFAIGPIPDGVFSGGRLAEPTRLAESIKDLLRGYRFNAKRAVLGISGRYGVTRMITLPKMSSAQTRDAINLQLNQYVPFPPADSIYDFKVLREVKEEETPSQEVLLVATRRSSLMPLMRVMKLAGLSLVGIKITTLASFGLFEDLYLDAEQAIAFVDVRENVTDISFVSENYFRLSRSIEFGLANLTERLRLKMGLNRVEAVDHLYRNRIDLMESYRPPVDLTAEEGSVEAAPSGMPPGVRDPADLDRQLGLVRGDDTIEKQVRDAVLRAMGQFVNELMRSIRYFESQQKRRARVGRVVMFGYIGGLEGLTEYLAEQTGLEVTVVSTLPGVESALDSADEQELRGREAILVVPLGLGVEAIKKKKIDLNLVPRETVYRRKSFNAMKFAVVVVLILAAVLLNIYIERNNELNKFKKQESDLQAKIDTVEPYYNRAVEFKGHIQTVEGKLKGIVTLAAAQPPWPVIMDEMGRVMRDSAWLDEMHWDSNGATWEVHGYCVGTDEMQRLLVNFWHSEILTPADAEDIDADVEKSEGSLGSGFGGGGTGGGRGASAPAPGGPEFENSSDGSDFVRRLPGMPPGLDPSDLGAPPIEPMYKLPPSGQTGLEIEFYFRGQEYIFPIFYEFKLGGTINNAVMQSGKDLFGDLAYLAGAGGAPATPGAPAAGGAPGAPTPSAPGMPGLTGGGG